MNSQHVLLNLIVFTLPIISLVYIYTGIKLYKYKADEQFNYFSLFMFAAAIYTAGYFLALNALNTEVFLLARSFEYLGVVLIPTFGILFVSAYTKNKLSQSSKLLLFVVSGLLWSMYITNPLYHWTYKRIEMTTAQGFSIASTTKNFGYFFILAYYTLFLAFSVMVLFKTARESDSLSLKRSCRLLLGSIQFSWVAVLIILLGFDTFFDPTPIVILFISILIGISEVRNDFFQLEINRWENTFLNIGEVAFLINSDEEIVSLNARAEDFWKGKNNNIAGLTRILDQGGIKQRPVMIPVNDRIRWFQVNRNVFNQKRKLISYLLSDITEHKKAEQALKESEEKNRLLITQMAQGLAVHEVILDETEKVVDYRFLDANESYERLTGLKKEKIIGKTVLEVLPETETYWIDTYGRVAMTGEPVHYENYSQELGKHFEVVAYSPRFKEFAVIISDISNRKQAEEDVYFLSYHDYLTGLYNRRFYEEELARLDTAENLPMTLIMADVNGLKLINDSFGHAMGDELLKKAAQLISAACPEGSIVARLGGDEFIMILPQQDVFQAVETMNNLKTRTASERIGSFDLSISFGCETKEAMNQDIQEIYKHAEDDMYRHKLYESASVKSKTIDLIMNTLYEKSSREMRHSQRVGELCKMIATEMKLEKDVVNQIGVAGLMHDIGKMGIDERILNKEGILEDDEWMEIQRHPEIGYRILSSSNEFSEIANYVFEHHERWDGNGYPKKLCGEEISIEARIIAVADSYDSMICDRSYRKGLSDAEAIREIRRCAGKQFDAAIAKVFIEKVLQQEKLKIS